MSFVDAKSIGIVVPVHTQRAGESATSRNLRRSKQEVSIDTHLHAGPPLSITRAHVSFPIPVLYALCTKMKSKAEGDGVLVTEEQQSWIKTQHMTHRLRPLKRVTLPGDPVGDWCYKVSHHKWFDASVMICIVLNTIVMAMQFFGQGSVYTR